MQRIVKPTTSPATAATAATTAPADAPATAALQQAPGATPPGSPRLQENASLQGLQRAGSASQPSIDRSAFAATAPPATPAAPPGPPTSPQAFFPRLEQWAAAPHCSAAEKNGRRVAAQRISDAFENESYDLNLDNLNLSSLPEGLSLMTDLRELLVRKNQLTQLTDLPAGLLALDITDNQFERLGELPPRLEDFSGSYNRFVELPVPPPTLKIFCVEGNQLTRLPPLNCPIFLARLGNNRLTNLNGMPHTLRFLSVEPELIRSTIIQLETRIATLIRDTDFYMRQQASTPRPDTAVASPLPQQGRPGLPGPFQHLNAEATEALLANLEPGSADLVALSRTSAGFHAPLQPRIEADREIATIDAELILLRHLQQANRP